MPQRSSRWLAFALVAAYVVAAAAIGVTLLAVAGREGTPIAEVKQEPPATVTTTARETAPPAATTTKPPEATGFIPAAGPNGVTSVVPKGWELKPCTTSDCKQADDPADPNRFVRLGAVAAGTGPMLAERTAYEKQFSAGRVNFQRVKLDAVAHHGSEAVDWEFEYDLNGVRRHVKTLLWRAGGWDNWVYASSELKRWPETREIYDAMVTASRP